MEEKDWAQKLKGEGFSHTYVWQDGPGTSCPDHTHATETAHIIFKRGNDPDHKWAHHHVSHGRSLRRSGTSAALGEKGARRLPVSDWGKINMIAVQHSLRAEEKALLDFLLSADFPGRDALRIQAENVDVAGECECGCGTIELAVPAGTVPAKTEKSMPIEAHGEALDVLLFARNGLLGTLEIVFYADPSQRPYPQPDQLKLWARPHPSAKNLPSS